MLYKSRKDVIKFYDDYSSMMSESLYKSFKITRINILTPIAPAQVKTGNNSENLLNEIRQIVYSLYQSKEITKKVYNNIVKIIQI